MLCKALMLHRNTHAVKSFRYSGHIKTHPNSPRDAQIISNQSTYPLIKLRFLNVKSNHEFLIKARYNTACRQIRIIVSLLKRLVKSPGFISFQMFTNKIWLSIILTIVVFSGLILYGDLDQVMSHINLFPTEVNKTCDFDVYLRLNL